MGIRIRDKEENKYPYYGLYKKDDIELLVYFFYIEMQVV